MKRRPGKCGRTLTIRFCPNQQGDTLESVHIRRGDMTGAPVIPLPLCIERVQFDAPPCVRHVDRELSNNSKLPNRVKLQAVHLLFKFRKHTSITLKLSGPKCDDDAQSSVSVSDERSHKLAPNPLNKGKGVGMGGG